MNNENTLDIGRKIKILREIKNYTQEYMADKLNISQRSYSGIERGEVSPTISRLFEISKILSITVCNLIDFDPSKIVQTYNNIEKGNNNLSQETIDIELKNAYDKLLLEKDKRIVELEKQIERFLNNK